MVFLIMGNAGFFVINRMTLLNLQDLVSRACYNFVLRLFLCLELVFLAPIYRLPLQPKSTHSSMVVPFGGSYLEFYKVIPKRNYMEPMGKP